MNSMSMLSHAGRRSRGLLALARLIAALGVIVGLVVPISARASESAYSWSDCLYDKPLPAAHEEVYSYAHGITLRCGGVRHIKGSHGFNHYTENCIGQILDHNTRETSKDHPENWVYVKRVWFGGGVWAMWYTGYVSVNKASLRIVTSWLESGFGGVPDDDWAFCDKNF